MGCSKADFIFKNPIGLLLRDLENHEIFVRFYQSHVPMLRGNESLKSSHVNISKPKSDIQEKWNMLTSQSRELRECNLSNAEEWQNLHEKRKKIIVQKREFRNWRDPWAKPKNMNQQASQEKGFLLWNPCGKLQMRWFTWKRLTFCIELIESQMVLATGHSCHLVLRGCQRSQLQRSDWGRTEVEACQGLPKVWQAIQYGNWSFLFQFPEAQA